MSHPAVEGLNDPDLAKVIAEMYWNLQKLRRWARRYAGEQVYETIDKMVMRIDLLIDERHETHSKHDSAEIKKDY